MKESQLFGRAKSYQQSGYNHLCYNRYRGVISYGKSVTYVTIYYNEIVMKYHLLKNALNVFNIYQWIQSDLSHTSSCFLSTNYFVFVSKTAGQRGEFFGQIFVILFVISF